MGKLIPFHFTFFVKVHYNTRAKVENTFHFRAEARGEKEEEGKEENVIGGWEREGERKRRGQRSERAAVFFPRSFFLESLEIILWRSLRRDFESILFKF
jgi:hypothetical protein